SSPPPAPSAVYTLSLHDALPIFPPQRRFSGDQGQLVKLDQGDPSSAVARALPAQFRTDRAARPGHQHRTRAQPGTDGFPVRKDRSEEHTSELQSRENLVCRLLLE